MKKSINIVHGGKSIVGLNSEIEISHFVKLDLALGDKAVDLGIDQFTDKFIDRYSGTFGGSSDYFPVSFRDSEFYVIELVGVFPACVKLGL